MILLWSHLNGAWLCGIFKAWMDTSLEISAVLHVHILCFAYFASYTPSYARYFIPTAETYDIFLHFAHFSIPDVYAVTKIDTDVCNISISPSSRHSPCTRGTNLQGWGVTLWFSDCVKKEQKNPRMIVGCKVVISARSGSTGTRETLTANNQEPAGPLDSLKWCISRGKASHTWYITLQIL